MEHRNKTRQIAPSSDQCILASLAIRAGKKRILTDINLNIQQTGLYAIMGPVGVGKSALLSVLGGHGNDNGWSYMCDVASYAGKPLGRDNHPVVIEQASRGEQARRAIDGGSIGAQITDALAQNPAVLCLDEPTAGVPDNEALLLLNWLKLESKKRAIVMVTHNSEQARSFADWVLLLGGGSIVEQGPAGEFFDNPATSATKHFIKTGSLALPGLDAHPRQLSPENRGITEGINTKTVGVVDGVLSWIIHRSFAIARLAADIEAAPGALISFLKSRSVSVVVASQNTKRMMLDALAVEGIEIIPFTYSAPAAPRIIPESLALAEQIAERIDAGRVVAVLENHSEKRSESVEVLAAVQLIHLGITAKDAIDLLNVKSMDVGIHLHDEQFLWDLELVLNLSADKNLPTSERVNMWGTQGQMNGDEGLTS